MQDVKLLTTTAASCGLFATLVCLVVYPNLYRMINEIHSELIDGMRSFRVETDSAWNEMMEIQTAIIPLDQPKQNPFTEFSRRKRLDFPTLPDYCVCEIPKIKCPPGPAGPRGEPGPQGRECFVAIFCIS
ncbi:hypothetical protein AB6A40_011295 [Gnathostoma spinigerum]|uniref:Nematode cuticle collagen N-terminal domain-containing protein n=1 Tax=Gnathostoma spinigerum TaxID=75299 RepID=A0ABD6EYY3_9BILA